MITIIDYGVGNLRSVQKGFEHVGLKAEIVDNPEAVVNAPAVVLPGVGAFKDAMESLKKTGMDQAVQEVVKKGTPLLGICLGLQLLFNSSEEFGLTEGLGIIPGKVVKFDEGLKIPHMGWNEMEIVNPNPIIKGIPNGSAFYFVHSYYCLPDHTKDIVTATEYGIKYTSIAAKDNVFGIQFHPEKSSTLGLQILKNFGELI
jgi:imidazole glycerol-phosphate synthase subunit HisH